MSGFGNHVATEAVPGALPVGANSPQKVPFGLYAEQISGTAFTTPRAENRRSWLYRMRPSADHAPFDRYPRDTAWRSSPFDHVPIPPNRMRWDPLPFPAAATDFIDAVVTVGGNGEPGEHTGMAIHWFAATLSMVDRFFSDADGELLVVPQQGRLAIATELGRLELAPGQIALLPRGIRFRVDLPDGAARGYLCENFGAPFRLPDLGPIGANGLANPRDFEAPEAGFEDHDVSCDWVQKFMGSLWVTRLDHSPLDVVAWHGNLVPYTYDLVRFNTINSVSYDHPDPSIFTVLTAPGARAGMPACDFAVFPPRWLVAENTFRPPWFHRNVMSEFMGLLRGRYDGKERGFVPGGSSLHNAMTSHGPDRATYERAIEASLVPAKIDDTLAFMFESSAVIRPTQFALATPLLQRDYDACWAGFAKARLP